jgi:hypothetical protein
MDETCALCGKKLSWILRRQNPKLKPKIIPEFQGDPEFLDKKLCYDCLAKVRRSFAIEGLEKPFKEGLELGKRIVVIKNPVRLESIGKQIEFYSKVAEKFGYVYKSETHSSDLEGLIYSLSIIFEKVIPTENETNFVNCQHCTTRYDANQYFKCPQCGAPADLVAQKT